MAEHDATERIAGHSGPARGGVRISDFRGPNGEVYAVAVDGLGRARVEVHIHDPADEELVISLLRLYIQAIDEPHPVPRLRLL